MRLKNQDELLKIEVRKQIIAEIEGTENKQRKYEHFKRHQVYKDNTKYFVIKNLERQFDQKTLQEMEYALANISVGRKIIDKLARVYSSGVKRTVMMDDSLDLVQTDKVNTLEKELCINEKQKTLNKYLKLHKNTIMYVKPCPYIEEDGREVYDILLQPTAPYLYDAIENFYDRTKPVAYILSNYEFSDMSYSTADAAKEGRSLNSSGIQAPLSDKKDQVIADKKIDEGANNKEYIWWSDKYHFTTNALGEITSDSTMIENPIGKMPMVDYAIDRDNSFWAEGGSDIAEGAILINSMLSHLNHIAVTQGYGQFWMKGKNLPRNIVLGPSKAVIMEYDNEDPVPDIGFANSGANIDGVMKAIEMYAALLLTTNNLSTSGVSTQLGGGSQFPSAIAMFIDKAESMEDVSDQRQVFLDAEPDMFEIISKWIKLFTVEGTLDESLVGLELEEEFQLSLQFNDSHIMQTEGEKLANIKMRKELGINTLVDLIKMDQPDLTDKQAEEKLKNILKEKLSRTMDAMAQVKSQEVINDNGQENQRGEESPIQ